MGMALESCGLLVNLCVYVDRQAMAPWMSLLAFIRALPWPWRLLAGGSEPSDGASTPNPSHESSQPRLVVQDVPFLRSFIPSFPTWFRLAWRLRAANPRLDEYSSDEESAPITSHESLQHRGFVHALALSLGRSFPAFLRRLPWILPVAGARLDESSVLSNEASALSYGSFDESSQLQQVGDCNV